MQPLNLDTQHLEPVAKPLAAQPLVTEPWVLNLSHEPDERMKNESTALNLYTY